ncbi:hypothetical protein [Sphingomonas sp.]|uniref:hypothetical protein n=1 Tax=Sphingomonas sp. TaxID=28214 RepID=UPI002DD69B1A|nr:hypothetical protein [Sphingomonas sp.]
MSIDFGIVLAGCVAALALMTVSIYLRAREAEKTGELKYRVSGVVREHIIRRADDPARFALELKILRAVPWMGFSLLAVTIAMMGFFS